MSSFFAHRRIVVTGGDGFLGSFIIEKLAARGASNVFVPVYPEYDFVKREDVLRMLDEAKPDLIIHLAAVVGGIGANRENPGKFYYENLMMGTQLMHEAYSRGVDKFVAIGTICAYPKFTPVPFREDDLWNGYPEETNAPYGIAKKALLVQAQSYRAQYGFNAIYLLPVNLYGPRDNFDIDSSHVIPALIRKFVTARETGAGEVTLWGTGTPTREFQYVEDCAEGILLASEHFDGAEPVNIGSGEEISIADLAALIARLTGFEGSLVYDPSQPDGQPRRLLDITRAEKEFGYSARVSLEDGLKRTIEWYLSEGRKLWES